MTKKTKKDDITATTEETSNVELQALKSIADKLGVKFHTNIGVDKLKEKIELHLQNTNNSQSTANLSDLNDGFVYKDTTNLSAQEKRQQLIDEQTRLKRVRITCMNPNKKDHKGEVITVGNSVIPTQKRFIPFDAEEGWHVPVMILTVLKERKFQAFRTVRRNGIDMKEGYLVPEFAIEELPPLTAEELKQIANRQIAEKSIQ